VDGTTPYWTMRIGNNVLTTSEYRPDQSRNTVTTSVMFVNFAATTILSTVPCNTLF